MNHINYLCMSNLQTFGRFTRNKLRSSSPESLTEQTRITVYNLFIYVIDAMKIKTDILHMKEKYMTVKIPRRTLKQPLINL